MGNICLRGHKDKGGNVNADKEIIRSNAENIRRGSEKMVEKIKQLEREKQRQERNEKRRKLREAEKALVAKGRGAKVAGLFGNISSSQEDSRKSTPEGTFLNQRTGDYEKNTSPVRLGAFQEGRLV